MVQEKEEVQQLRKVQGFMEEKETKKEMINAAEASKAENVETAEETKAAAAETETKTAAAETETKTAAAETETKTAAAETETKTAAVESETKTAAETKKENESETSKKNKRILWVVIILVIVGVLVGFVYQLNKNKEPIQELVTVSEDQVVAVSENIVETVSENVPEEQPAFGEALQIASDLTVIEEEEGEFIPRMLDADGEEITLQGITMENNRVTYSIGEVEEASGEETVLTLHYTVTLTSDFVYDTETTYENGITWQGDFKELKFRDYYTGILLNDFEGVPGEQQEATKEIEYNGTTFEISIVSQYEAKEVTYTEWEAGEDDLYRCEGTTQMEYVVTLTMPAGYDGILASVESDQEDGVYVRLLQEKQQ